MTIIETMKQALEDLERRYNPDLNSDGMQIVTNLRTAIAALESAEPVAWMNTSGKTCSDDWKRNHARDDEADSFYKPLFDLKGIK